MTMNCERCESSRGLFYGTFPALAGETKVTAPRYHTAHGVEGSGRGQIYDIILMIGRI
jgi:hypothetical protein